MTSPLLAASRRAGRAQALPRCLLHAIGIHSGSRAEFASAALKDAETTPSTSGQGPSSPQLTPDHVGSYYPLNLALLPEAARASAAAFYAPRDAGHERRGGCKALQQEMETTGRASVLYRPFMAALNGAVAGGQQSRLLLTGPAGCGKSMALLALVEWARQQGWLVVYVPSCLALVRGGYFAPRGRGAAGGFDTLTSAQQLLKGVMDAHGPMLQSLPVLPVPGRAARRQQQAGQQAGQKGEVAEAADGGKEGSPGEEPGAASARGGGGGGRTLHDVALRGLSRDDNAQAAVDCALQLVRQLQLHAASPAADTAAAAGGAQPPPQSQPQPQPPRVLFALDDYNYLYGPTDYGVQPPYASPLQGRRRVLDAGELILARGLRLLEAEAATAVATGSAAGAGGAVVVAATTATPALPAPRSLALDVPHTVVEVPGFSEADTYAALAHYAAAGAATRPASAAEARHLYMLTGGNGRELRAKAGALGVRVG